MMTGQSPLPACDGSIPQRKLCKGNRRLHRQRLALLLAASFVAYFSLFGFWKGASADPTASPSGEQASTSQQKARGDATILIYHRFGDNRYPITNVGIENFKEQMAYLAQNGYHVVPLSELVAMLKDNRPLPEKVAAITIDDGYRTVYTEAWPILKSYGFPFTVFLYVKAVDRGYTDFVTWEQVREMEAAGADFEDHSYSHFHLANWPSDMTEQDYRQWIRNDLLKGNEKLTAKLGHSPRYLAIPYGEYNRIVIEEAKAVGYDAIFTQDPGSVSDDTDIFQCPREPILGNDWSSMEHFITVLQRVDLPLTDLTPSIDPLTNPTPPRFGAKLLHPERYAPHSFGIYVSELGWQQAHLEGDFVSIANTATLIRQINRVMISAREKDTGKTAVRFWMLVNR